jgi:hypothetical protein
MGGITVELIPVPDHVLVGLQPGLMIPSRQNLRSQWKGRSSEKQGQNGREPGENNGSDSQTHGKPPPEIFGVRPD